MLNKRSYLLSYHIGLEFIRFLVKENKMKNFKPFFITLLFLAMNTLAAPAKEASKLPIKQENVASVLQAVSIEAQDRQLTINNEGQALIAFKYIVTNLSNKPISAIQWLSVYVNKREVVHSHDMQIDLESPLMPGKSFSINLQIPFVQIQEKFRPIFTDPQAKIDVYPIDRLIRFNDKKELRER